MHDSCSLTYYGVDKKTNFFGGSINIIFIFTKILKYAFPLNFSEKNSLNNEPQNELTQHTSHHFLTLPR